MAGRGPAPGLNPAAKSDGERRRRNAPAASEKTVLASDGAVYGPELPDVFEESWHPRTVAWWQTWRESAQAKTFTGTDWDFLIDTALMHHTMWSKGRWEFAAELRLRAGKFGATPEDRARLKIDVVSDPEPVKPRPQGRPAANRRERLLKAVGDGD